MVRIFGPFSSHFLGMTLFVSMLATACSNPSQQAGQGPSAIPVQVQEVKTSTVKDATEFVGALEAQDRVALKPETDGRIVAIFVSPGQTVKKGTQMVQLRADRRQAQVSGAGADVEAARSARSTAAANVSAAEAERVQARADVELRTSEFSRIQALVNQGAETQQRLDEVTNARDTAIAALKAAEERVKAAEASLQEAEARLSRSQADQAVAREDLQDNRVIAPIDGVVGNVPVKVGDYVTTSDTLTSIIQNQALDLNLSIPIERSPELRVGMPVELVDTQGKPLVRGRISFVSPEVSAADQSVLAKASFPNNGALKDGQFVRAKVIWQSGPGVLVPSAAVTRVAGQTFVYVAEQAAGENGGEAKQVARQRRVELGNIQGNEYQVLSGVKAGEQIIVSGILNLQDGAPIVEGSPQAQPSPAR